MFLAKIRNSQDELLALSEATDRFVVSSIIGLNPPPAQINTTNIVGMDGAQYNSAFVNTRNIVITLMLRGDQEASRQELLQYFQCKGLCRFYFQNNNAYVYIDGYVESIEYDIFQRTETMQVSIICPFPLFSDLTQQVVPLTGDTSQFYFPYAIDTDDPVEFSTYSNSNITTINNDGQNEYGFICAIKFNDSASSLEIRKVIPDGEDESVYVSYSFTAGDIVTFSSVSNDISFILHDYDPEINLFNYTHIGDVDVLKITQGVNYFQYAVDYVANSAKADVTIIYRQSYQGV